jgi:two-component SAPR family response regulator
LTNNEAPLTGRRILVVEDDFNIAHLMAKLFKEDGAEIVGPVGTVKDALALIAGDERIDGAVLDVNLRGEMVYPVADVLRLKGVRIVFTTGYSESLVAPDYAEVPSLQKPVNADRLIRALFG